MEPATACFKVAVKTPVLFPLPDPIPQLLTLPIATFNKFSYDKLFPIVHSRLLRHLPAGTEVDLLAHSFSLAKPRSSPIFTLGSGPPGVDLLQGGTLHMLVNQGSTAGDLRETEPLVSSVAKNGLYLNL